VQVGEPLTDIPPREYAIGKSTVELLSTCSRLMDLLDTPEDIRFRGDTIQREIVYPFNIPSDELMT
jgi:hypothetical protein